MQRKFIYVIKKSRLEEIFHSNKNGRPEQRTSAQALVATTHKGGGTASLVKRCRYCSQSNWSDECTKYMTLSERKDHMEGSRYRCLKEGHLSFECNANKKCVYFDKMNVHHRSLCPVRFITQSTVSSMSTELMPESILTSNTSNISEITEEKGLMSMNEMVLMQTASTQIKIPSTKENAGVHLVLDSGSHRSYISEKVSS